MSAKRCRYAILFALSVCSNGLGRRPKFSTRPIIWTSVVPIAICLLSSSALSTQQPGTLLHTFATPTPTNFARFGQGVAGVGDNILVGGERAGAAYIYSGATGNLLITIPSPVPGNSDGFGFSAAGTANTAFVGAVVDSTVENRAGAVYAFDATNGSLLRTFRADANE